MLKNKFSGQDQMIKYYFNLDQVNLNNKELGLTFITVNLLSLFKP